MKNISVPECLDGRGKTQGRERLDMPRYLFLYSDGYTEIMPGVEVHNRQELGDAAGANPQEAWENFVAENPWVEDYDIMTDAVYAVEIVGEIECISVEYNNDLWEHVGGPES